MGCVNGKERDENEEREYDNNKLIEKKLKVTVKEEQTHVKLILLGTGDSGKSTFAKQMKVLHKNGFSHTETLYYQNVLRVNCLNSMQRVLDEFKNKLSLSEGTIPNSISSAATIIENASELTEEVAEAVKQCWDHKEIKNFLYKELDKLQIPSSAPYYFDHSNRFAKENYKPTDEDILRAKLKTTGIYETKFKVNEIEFTMVDVGGQRAERRKWLHCFDGVSAVIYLAALDEYNMFLQEDPETNRLDESLRLFSDITSSQWFGNKSLILFLNKSDIFKEKIFRFPLTDWFKNDKELPDEMDTSKLKEVDPKTEMDIFEKGVKYISSKYEKIYQESGKSKLYPFVTNALDTSNCKKVFDAVRDTVISSSLVYAGFS